MQTVGCLTAWIALSPISPVLAQSVSLCFFIPTATAAPAITGMLGGNVGFLTSYLFLGNMATILTAPLLIPLFSQHGANLTYLSFMLQVFCKVTPTLLLPLFLAWGVRMVSPAVSAAIVRKSWISYYIWAVMILILISSTFDSLFAPGQKNWLLEAILALAGVSVCLLLFYAGRRTGRRFSMPIASGQALAQKNLLFGMWLVFQYLDMAVLITLTAYSIFQNMFNAWQLWQHDRRAAA